jgi:site-specific recombinase XerD
MNVNHYYTRPWIFNRYLIGPIAPYLTQFSEFLAKQGYAYATGHRYVREVGHLSKWLAREGVNIDDLNTETINTYLRFRYQDHDKINRAPCRHLLNYLKKNGIVETENLAETVLDQCLTRYEDHMVRNQGLAKETIRVRIRVARNFLSLQFEKTSFDLSSLQAADIEQYFLHRSHHCNNRTLKTEASALRCFLRYLQFRGEISVHLIDSVPTIPSWRYTTIPEYLTTDEMNLLIQNSERETPMGQRDIAILLLLTRLGLRAIEICRLTLDDIDWDAGVITIPGKNGRVDRLPLLQDVGAAISGYLSHGRPLCSTRHVFVRTVVPFEPFADSSSVANVVRNALRRAKLNPPRKGTHLLRRSLATMMLQKGASLIEIGQILRHQKSDTTAIYAKVDLDRLRTISRPWPGGDNEQSK